MDVRIFRQAPAPKQDDPHPQKQAYIYMVQKYQKVHITVGHYQFTSELSVQQGHVGLCVCLLFWRWIGNKASCHM